MDSLRSKSQFVYIAERKGYVDIFVKAVGKDRGNE